MTSVPSATYRLQLNPQFTFQDAIAILDYLAELNISHIYASSYLQPAAGSMHGYDVADPTSINKDLGGRRGQQKFFKALAQKSLGQIIDVIPNHMTTKCPDNSWWMSVLKYGLASPYAEYFDIHWKTPNDKLVNKIVIPILTDDLAKELADKKIQLQYNEGIFTISYSDYIFPVSPLSLAPILQMIAKHLQLNSLEAIAAELNDINQAQIYYADIQALEHKIIKELLSSDDISSPIESIVKAINNQTDQLYLLLQEQNYSLACWQVSNTAISYRRFFSINSLVGLCIENEKVFMDTHRLILQWIKTGQTSGMRIDCIDGLRNPYEYLQRLRLLAPDAWIIVEKILLRDEITPSDWPIDGTTGYDFLNSAMGLFIDSKYEKLFTDFYVKFIGGKADYYEVLREKKLFVLHNLFGGDVNFLGSLIIQICEERGICDFASDHINTAIRELIACFPVYRTYIRQTQPQINKRDEKIITETVKKAKNMASNLDPRIFDFLEAILLLQSTGKKEVDFAMRFQQLTGSAMAKGGEDTAFYCFNRFVALNEVGGDPSVFGVSIETFHRSLQDNVKRQPHSMLTTSTHDAKRSEDIRSRLALLSEIPNAWFSIVQEWVEHNEKHHAENVPDRNTQYFLYQHLVGAWPIEKSRLISFMEKAVREAKIHTSCDYPNSFYEQKLRRFIDDILVDKEFCSSLEIFLAPLIKFGRINSLSQLAIKLTAVGIPDFYQGSELWSFNFVDPDNRRPVDLQANYRLFREMKSLSLDEIMVRMDEGLPKLWLTYKGLEMRKKYAQLFANADYLPLMLTGAKAECGIAFLRGEKVLTFAKRLVITLQEDWGKTYLNFPSGVWRNILTAETITGGRVMVADIIKKFPVAIFIKE